MFWGFLIEYINETLIVTTIVNQQWARSRNTENWWRLENIYYGCVHTYWLEPSVYYILLNRKQMPRSAQSLKAFDELFALTKLFAGPILTCRCGIAHTNHRDVSTSAQGHALLCLRYLNNWSLFLHPKPSFVREYQSCINYMYCIKPGADSGCFAV